MGLKKFYDGVKKIIPFYQSPFERMSKELQQKLSRKKKNKTKPALSFDEWEKLMIFLNEDLSVKGLQNKALVFLLYYTGLRSFELLSLKFKDIEMYEGSYFVSGTGKGNKPFYQEVSDKVAVEAVYSAFKMQHRREPRPEDYLFYSLESYRGKEPVRMSKVVLWNRLQDIYKKLRANKIITRKLEFSAHLFRRSIGTHLTLNRMPLKAVQEFMRHSSLEVTAKSYMDIEARASDYLKKSSEKVS
jgi:integrase/recombinase XerD